MSVPTASAPTAASAIGVTDVRRVWPEVLAEVQRRRRTTQILLASATVISVESGVLLVAMPSAGMARRVLEPANSDLLRAALKQVLGVDWTIKCEAGDGPAGSAARGPATSPTGPNPAGDDAAEPPQPPPEDDIPDDYGEPPDPMAVQTVRDPEEAAIALLTTELGARRLDPPA